jgi:hypothetical protein
MRILFYAPFKPLDHAHPSGDLVTATGIVDYLINKGHQVVAASKEGLFTDFLKTIMTCGLPITPITKHRICWVHMLQAS